VIQNAAAKEFPPGAVRQTKDLPPSRLRAQIEGLSPAVHDRAMNWLGSFHFTDQDLNSLHADADGGIYYVDNFTLGTTEEPSPGEPITSEAAVPIFPLPPGLRFHSKPGSANTLFINFTGENITNTAWNSSLSRTVIPAVSFSLDSDFTTFSDAEQVAIKRIWQRVAEDFAPFDIDVTTERPATFTTRTAHALITRNTDANGLSNPSSSAGGVGYVGVFAGSSYANYRPAWIYYNNLASKESYIAEAASHEIGHNLGLSHDGRSDGSEYYGGHGSGDTSWGPLMGTGYNRNVTQWSKGDYYLANNTEDDLEIISAKVPYRTDDHGDTLATATALVVTGGTNIAATTIETDPANTNAANKGVLERNTDADAFAFVTGSGPIDLSVNPWLMPAGSTRGGNLDARIELFDAAGVLLVSNNYDGQTIARVQTTLAEGLYYILVKNAGSGDPFSSSPSGYTTYGSIGQYTITGYLTATHMVIPPQASLKITDLDQPGVRDKLFTVSYTDNAGVDASGIDGNDLLVVASSGYSQSAQLVSLSGTADGLSWTATYSVHSPTGPTWTESDDGIYSIWMQPGQVQDIEGAWVAAANLGQFTVSVPQSVYLANMDENPGWTFESQWQYGAPAYTNGSGPAAPFSGTNLIGFNLSGNYPNRLTTAYATTPVINSAGATSLTLRFQRWLGLKTSDTAVIQISTNGIEWVNIWSTTSAISDGAWQRVQYSLPAWAVGSPTLRLRWGLGSNATSNDIGWNIDDVEIFGTVQATLNVVSQDCTRGQVTPASGTYSIGSSIQILATPSNYFRFVGWTGDVVSADNPLTVVLHSNLTIRAEFSEIVAAGHSTPCWWLAAHGRSDDPETAEASLGANGMPLWQSYVAGLDPDDPFSQLRLSVSPSAADGGAVLHWNPVPGRVYSISETTNLFLPFTPVPDAAALPDTIHCYTNSGSDWKNSYYRLDVRLP